jgi:hypothetical protein
VNGSNRFACFSSEITYLHQFATIASVVQRLHGSHGSNVALDATQ